MSTDRIIEIYEGTAGSTDEQDRARERLHWACAQATGYEVLDIGCGQGVAALLLAREGRTVVGIDRDPVAVEFARTRLAREEEAVRSRVCFGVREAHDLTLEAGTFDTVLVLHVLDSQLDMTPMLSEARRVLRPDGHVVVTLPYGAAAGPQSTEPVYLHDLLQEVARRFAIQDVVLVGDAIGLVLKRGSTRGRLSARLLDRALGVAEQRLREQDLRVAEQGERIEALAAPSRSSELARVSRERESYADQRDAACERVARLEAELIVMRRRAADLSSAAGALRKELKALERRERERRVLASRVAELERLAARQAVQVQRFEALRGSTSYRVIKRLWRISAFVRRVLGRAGPRVADKSGDRSSPKREGGSSSGAARPPAARPSVDGDPDPERRLFLAGDIVAAPRTAPRTLDDLRVAAVVGSPLRAALAPECDLVTFRPDNWRYVVEARPPHLLLVESTWLGNGRSWQYHIADSDPRDTAALDTLLMWCADQNVPTVFWATRPAVELKPFVRTGREFDHVYVADPAAAQLWESAATLPLAVQPRLHHPGAEDRSTAVTYAGRYSNRWPAHDRAMLDMILDAGLPHGLRILGSDRGLVGANGSFPARFAAVMEPPNGRDAAVRALQRTRVAVTTTPHDPDGAMLPGPVLEALACGSAVVGPPHAAAESMFAGAARGVRTAAEAAAALDELLSDEPGRAARVEQARQALLREHTYAHRLTAIAAASGYRFQD